MHQRLLVQAGQNIQNLARDAQRHRPGQGTQLQPLRQRKTVKKFRRHHHVTLQGQRGEERNYVGVREPGANPHFAQKSLASFLVFGGASGQGLQILQPLGDRVLHPVLNQAARASLYVEELIPGVGSAEFELHPTGLLAGETPNRAAIRQRRIGPD